MSNDRAMSEPKPVAIPRRGLMLVLSSPSGAGKSTLSRRLLQSDSLFAMSVSATTRSKRPNEVEGEDYYFVTPERFEDMVKAGEFLGRTRPCSAIATERRAGR